ncbi:glycosyltransferase family 4 protein [Algoriphagus sp. PAP.12]|uniref:glycosyltransferase family 4 protein n=1 Tax=Algoriphagus sp. PAP.12 TaxID=2996678 RepID=UPI00227BD6E1|nr:glycosyltransferase family 4 protein [Algoriphagus sp. PAP.12]
MKVLFTQDALINAGTERSNLELISRFSREIDVSLVYFYPRHELKEQYQKAGIRLFFLDIQESYDFHLAIYRLIRLIKKEKPDLLVSSLWRADIITRVASWITGVTLVGTLVNDGYAPIAWTDKKGLKYKIVYWLDRLTAGIPKHWIANAEALAESHVNTLGLEKQKISVVYRGRSIPETSWRKIGIYGSVKGKVSLVGTEREQGLGNRWEDSNRQGLDGNQEGKQVNFISYGRLLERKGFQDAINAFSKVIQKYPNCTLTIFGEGTYRRELERSVHYLGLENNIFLPGKISDPSSILTSNSQLYSDFHRTSDIGHPATFHCFLFPSWYEGFSGALVEAMMAGIPIIASNIPMNLEAVNPETALIFEVQDSKQLARQMIFAIEHPDLMKKLGANARNEGIERFDIEKIAKQYEETLKGFLMSLKN